MRANFESHIAGPYGFQTSPLFAELAERLGREIPLAPSEAKRHHFIPQFMLRGFTSSDQLFQLDSASGAVHPVSVETAASRRWFYRFENGNGELDTSMESFLAIVEGHSATAFTNLMSPLIPLADSDRATLAFFFALLDARTPAARARSMKMQAEFMKLMAGMRLGDLDSFLASNPPIGDEDPESARLRLLKSVEDGSIGMANPERQAMHSLLSTAGTIADLAYAMDWFILSSKTGEFVTSDRGLAMHDENLRFPWTGHAWNTSETAETFIPLSRSCCMVIMPGRGRTESVEASPAEVTEVNQRIYGFADKYLFGDPQVLRRIHKWARRNPSEVQRPRPAYQSLLINTDPDDDSIAEAHRERGWPPQMSVIDDDGKSHIMDYLVIGLDGEALELAVDTNALVRKRHDLMSPADAAALRDTSVETMKRSGVAPSNR